MTPYLSRRIRPNPPHAQPTSNIDESDYSFNQSTQQAFYFINHIDENLNIEDGDWILSYNNGMLVGSRQWNGLYTDIPAMGYDGDINTAGYCQVGDVPEFVWIDSDGQSHDLVGSIPDWNNNEIYHISLQYNQSSIPESYTLSQNYPNPFNPSTTISFSIPEDGNVNLSIYDITGRLVYTLLNENIQSGSHEFTWDGVDMYGLNVSGGMYIYTLESKDVSISKKMMLMK